MVTTSLLWGILLSPLISALLIVLFLLRKPAASGTVALLGILLSFAGSIALLFQSLTHHLQLPIQPAFPWISVGRLQVDFGFLLDPLSVLMLLVVTGVGSCIFLYSIGYMRGDSSYPRFFASLSLFAFSMIGIVLSSNLLQLFLFWELVAVSSYLLIGFWFEKPSAADAGNKAFIVNRVADFGFLIGILSVWAISDPHGMRSFDYLYLAMTLPNAMHSGAITPALILTASLLIFCGVAGKSAQFPLYIWLPDAMEGPTPVSALIHAATMVAAGVYLLCRMFFLFETSPQALTIISYFGTATAFLAALLAVVQTDIKKILAYSTVSQLGYMVIAVGLGSAGASMYHLTTHAFFKALLFLGSGAMIHALHTQDIWKMGGLLKEMPVTAVTFLIGTFALCGIWPFAGFFSKDEILALAWGDHPVIFGFALATAGLTAFYMSRLVWVAVLGKKRSHAHAHEAPFVMRLPLVVLAVFSAGAGFIGIPQFLAGTHGEGSHHVAAIVPVIATATAAAGILLGTLLYARIPQTDDPLTKLPAFLYRTLIQKYWLDELFLAIAGFFNRVVAGLFLTFDLRIIIRSLVNGTAQATRGAGSVLRLAQTGRVQTYAVFFSLGILALMVLALLKG